MKVKIEITEDDIKNGERYSSYRCPIALALQRAIPEIQPADVMSHKVWSEKYQQYFDLAKEDYKFIHLFDTGFEVKPFSFEIEIP